jgi:hypothetical protein
MTRPAHASAETPTRPTPTPIPIPAPVEIPPPRLVLDPDEDVSESPAPEDVVACADAVVALAAVRLVADGVDFDVVDDEVDVVEEIDTSSLLMLKYAEDTSLTLVSPWLSAEPLKSQKKKTLDMERSKSYNCTVQLKESRTSGRVVPRCILYD